MAVFETCVDDGVIKPCILALCGVCECLDVLFRYEGIVGFRLGLGPFCLCGGGVIFVCVVILIYLPHAMDLWLLIV